MAEAEENRNRAAISDKYNLHELIDFFMAGAVGRVAKPEIQSQLERIDGLIVDCYGG
jgi:hypothetical protein